MPHPHFFDIFRDGWWLQEWSAFPRESIRNSGTNPSGISQHHISISCRNFGVQRQCWVIVNHCKTPLRAFFGWEIHISSCPELQGWEKATPELWHRFYLPWEPERGTSVSAKHEALEATNSQDFQLFPCSEGTFPQKDPQRDNYFSNKCLLGEECEINPILAA